MAISQTLCQNLPLDVKMEEMRKIRTMIIVLVAAAFFFAAYHFFPATKTKAPSPDKTGVLHPDPSEATFTFDDEKITLSAGQNEKNLAPGSALVETTVLLDKFAYGDLNGDGKEDTVLFLARYGAGSGTFIYLAAFVSGPVTYKGSEAIFIGDRIAPQSLSIKKGVVTIKYLDRGENEAMAAAPTKLVSKQFVYKAGEFQER